MSCNAHTGLVLSVAGHSTRLTDPRPCLSAPANGRAVERSASSRGQQFVGARRFARASTDPARSACADRAERVVPRAPHAPTSLKVARASSQRPLRAATLGLEALPLPAREAVVLFAGGAGGAGGSAALYERVGSSFSSAGSPTLRNLPQVSQGTLTALKELRFPVKCTSGNISDVLERARAIHCAYEIGTLNMTFTLLTDASPLAGCTTLRTLDLS